MSFANRALGRRRRSSAGLPPVIRGVGRIEALSQPVRLQLLDYVRRHGPATATEAGNALGLSPAATSYHLRVLAQNGCLTEVGDEPDGRKRRWQAAVNAMTVDPTAASNHEEAQALDRLEAAYFEHAADVFADYVENRSQYPSTWRQAATSVQDTLVLTPGETARLRADLLTLLARYRKRSERPADDATAVFLAFNLVPREPPRGQRSRHAMPDGAAGQEPSHKKLSAQQPSEQLREKEVRTS